MKILYILVITTIMACNSENKAKKATQSSDLINSLKGGMELSKTQLDKLIMPADGFITARAKAKGKNFYSISDSVLVVILEFDDGIVCKNELLITLNLHTGTRIDLKEIGNDCDIETGEQYTKLKYRFVNNSSLILIKKIYSKEDVDLNQPLTQVSTWKIRNDGRIVVVEDNSSKS